jgi:AcrR family transcriptional regulator
VRKATGVADEPAPTRRTERQLARRRAILHAVVALAAQGGYDAVQMREVADRSGVALGTLYRYFPSKIHLLVATMHDQLAQARARLAARPPTSADAGERVADALLRAFRGLQREPHLAEAMLRAFSFADRSVNAEVDAVTAMVGHIVADALRGAPAVPGTLDTPGESVRDAPPAGAERAAIRVVVHTWHSAVLTWLAGRASTAQVRADVETAALLISRAVRERSS